MSSLQYSAKMTLRPRVLSCFENVLPLAVVVIVIEIRDPVSPNPCIIPCPRLAHIPLSILLYSGPAQHLMLLWPVFAHRRINEWNFPSFAFWHCGFSLEDKDNRSITG